MVRPGDRLETSLSLVRWEDGVAELKARGIVGDKKAFTARVQLREEALSRDEGDDWQARMRAVRARQRTEFALLAGGLPADA